MSKLKKAFSRVKPTRSEQNILILCEGEVTEVKYFKHLRSEYKKPWTVDSVKQKTDPREIFAIARRKQNKYSQVHCVLDLENRSDRIEQFQSLAETEKIRFYPSNPCFEIWFLLHFGFTTKPFPDGDNAKEAVRKIKGMEDYDGTNADHDLLFTKLDDALRNARQLKKAGGENPSTKVHLLIELLKKLGA